MPGLGPELISAAQANISATVLLTQTSSPQGGRRQNYTKAGAPERGCIGAQLSHCHETTPQLGEAPNRQLLEKGGERTRQLEKYGIPSAHLPHPSIVQKRPFSPIFFKESVFRIWKHRGALSQALQPSSSQPCIPLQSSSNAPCLVCEQLPGTWHPEGPLSSQLPHCPSHSSSPIVFSSFQMEFQLHLKGTVVLSSMISLSQTLFSRDVFSAQAPLLMLSALQLSGLPVGGDQPSRPPSTHCQTETGPNQRNLLKYSCRNSRPTNPSAMEETAAYRGKVAFLWT